MDKMIFLNVGSMSKYSGPGKIIGGGKAVALQGYGHEMLNFKPFAGRMYGTAVTPGYGDIKLEKLGAAKGSDFVDGVLVVWGAKSKIVGWYRNARVFRRSQPPPKKSGRSYKGHSIGYRITAVESDCTILDHPSVLPTLLQNYNPHLAMEVSKMDEQDRLTSSFLLRRGV